MFYDDMKVTGGEVKVGDFFMRFMKMMPHLKLIQGLPQNLIWKCCTQEIV